MLGYYHYIDKTANNCNNIFFRKWQQILQKFTFKFALKINFNLLNKRIWINQ